MSRKTRFWSIRTLMVKLDIWRTVMWDKRTATCAPTAVCLWSRQSVGQNWRDCYLPCVSAFLAFLREHDVHSKRCFPKMKQPSSFILIWTLEWPERGCLTCRISHRDDQQGSSQLRSHEIFCPPLPLTHKSHFLSLQLGGVRFWHSSQPQLHRWYLHLE